MHGTTENKRGLRAALRSLLGALLASSPGIASSVSAADEPPMVLAKTGYLFVGGKIDSSVPGSPMTGQMYVELHGQVLGVTRLIGPAMVARASIYPARNEHVNSRRRRHRATLLAGEIGGNSVALSPNEFSIWDCKRRWALERLAPGGVAR